MTKPPCSDLSPKPTRILPYLIVIGICKILIIGGLFLDEYKIGNLLKNTLSLAQAASDQSQKEPAEQSQPMQTAAATPPASQAASSAAPAPVPATPAKNASPPTAQALTEERLALQRREETISRKEQDLKQLENELNARLAKLQRLETAIKKMIQDASSVKDAKIKHLITVYSNMKPKQAAQVLETLEEEISVKILAGMQGRQAGEILSYADPKKAAQLTEALTRFQMPNIPEEKPAAAAQPQQQQPQAPAAPPAQPPKKP